MHPSASGTALVAITLCGLAPAVPAQEPHDGHHHVDHHVRQDQSLVIATVRRAAIEFLDALSPELRDQATFDMSDPERKAWSNLPASAFKREGVSFAEMTPEQRRRAHRLIRSPLSSQGYLKTTGIMRIDQILQDFRRSEPPMFGHGLYWIGIFGDPRGDDPWGWQLDGHHLALNFTIANGDIAVTPTFMGSDPAEVRRGDYSGWYVLGAEDRKGWDLLESLDDAQRARAVISETAPRDVITGPGRGDRLSEPEGLPAADMTEAQRTLLLRLVGEYAHNLEHELAHAHLARIHDAGIDKLHFAWAGTEPGKPYYYRIHGPTVLIEFDNSYPPGAGDGPVNHIHTVWRHPGNDYGADLLRKHLLESPHHREHAGNGHRH